MKNKIKKSILTIYTTDNCGPCERVETIFRAEGYDLNVIPANLSRETARVMRDARVDGYPAIFKGMHYLGSGIMAVHKVDPDINIAKYMQEG